MSTIDAIEACRRSNARELVDTFLGDDVDHDHDAIVDALLEADPYERMFADIDTAGFWAIADRFPVGWNS